MKKIISIMDFAKGSKTQVMSVFTAVAIIFNLVFGVEINPEQLTNTVQEVFVQSEVIAGSIGIIYGLLMKVFRPRS